MEQVNETYRNLKVTDVPIFITSDSLLHLYHIQFDETLKRVEAEEFYDDLWKLDNSLLEASIDDYGKSIEDDASEEVTEAARRNVAYFAVALSLLEPKSKQIGQSGEDSAILFDPQDAKQYSIEVPAFVKMMSKPNSLIEAQMTMSQISKYIEDYLSIPHGTPCLGN